MPPKTIPKLIGDVAEYCYKTPKWNPMNVCSYHLRVEAGATPEQELAYALATAIAVLDELNPALRPRISPPLRSYFILCECRHPFRDRNVQNARLCGFVG